VKDCGETEEEHNPRAAAQESKRKANQKAPDLLGQQKEETRGEKKEESKQRYDLNDSIWRSLGQTTQRIIRKDRGPSTE